MYLSQNMSDPYLVHTSHLVKQVPLSAVGGKKSIFAQQIAAQRLKEGKVPLDFTSRDTPKHKPPEQKLPLQMPMKTDMTYHTGDSKSFSFLLSVVFSPCLHVFFPPSYSRFLPQLQKHAC